MSKVKYNPELSIEEISRISGVSEPAVRKYIRENFIDREYDSQLIRYRRIQQYFKENPDATFSAAATDLGKGYSRNTVEYYSHKENAPKPNENKIYLSMVDPSMSKATVATVSNEDRLILGIILRLYLKGKDRFDCDLTFSKGDFYRYGVQYPIHCFDLYPEKPGHLTDAPEVKPLAEGHFLPDDSLSSVIIDLPQCISDDGTGNPDTFRNISHLALSYYEMLKLAYAKLRYTTNAHAGGLLIVKVGDIMWHDKMLWMSKIVTELATGRLTRLSTPVYDELRKEADKQGTTVDKMFPLFDMELIDKYVHAYDPETVETPYYNRHSVKAHDYFLVFRKGENPNHYDTFYFGTDSELRDMEQLCSTVGVTSSVQKVVSRKSKAEGSFLYEVKIPVKNRSNHIEFQSSVSMEIRQAVSDELGISIPYHVCNRSERFLEFIKNAVSEKLTRESNLNPDMRKIPSAIDVSIAMTNLLRKAGVKFIQQSSGYIGQSKVYSRIILDECIAEIKKINEYE